VEEKPSSAEFAMFAGIDRIHCHTVAWAKPSYTGTELEHFAGKLVAKNERDGAACFCMWYRSCI
jgi:hypothetical protein